MLYFWEECGGNLKLITIGSERVSGSDKMNWLNSHWTSKPGSSLLWRVNRVCMTLLKFADACYCTCYCLFQQSPQCKGNFSTDIVLWSVSFQLVVAYVFWHWTTQYFAVFVQYSPIQQCCDTSQGLQAWTYPICSPWFHSFPSWKGFFHPRQPGPVE